jgi:dienelactone hydrolase
MTTVLLFHHAQGLTPGVLDLAGRLRTEGHVVHTPDLLDAKTFPTVDEGVAYVQEIGFDEVVRRGAAAAAELPPDIVYAGFSLGVMPAESLALNRAGARGAVFCHACVPPQEFGGTWPQAVPLQIHMMEDDPWAEEDLPAARALAEEAEHAELFLYPGSAHLFADPSLGEYDEAAAALLVDRMLEFLARVG